MTLAEVEALLAQGDLSNVLDIMDAHCIVRNISEALKQFEPKDHKVHDPSIRRDKMIKDEKGNITDVVKVSRLSLALQKKIVMIGAAFLGTPKVESNPVGQVQENLVQVMDGVWELNKLDYKFKSIAEHVMSEKHCAELWYTPIAEPDYWEGYPFQGSRKFGMKLLAPSLGDELYPVFDDFGDMIAFGRQYWLKELVNGKIEDIPHFDVYTAQHFYYTKQISGQWLHFDGKGYNSLTRVPIPSIFGKIPIIYYHQPAVEWADVQCLIERLETKFSNHADTNDYNDSPILKGKGKIKGFAEKGETGKLIELENDAELEYLVWNQAPESMKMEISNLLYMIHSLTHTPDISFENIKGLGQLSGTALDLFFMDAHLKAAHKEPIFAEGLQRRLNYLKKVIIMLDPSLKAARPMRFKPKFKFFRIEDNPSTITMLTNAVQGGILSTDTAVRQNPLVGNDPAAEIDAINREKEEAAKKALELANAKKGTEDDKGGSGGLAAA